MNLMNKTKLTLRGLISGLLLLAAGIAQTRAALLGPAAFGDALYVASRIPTNTIVKLAPDGVGSFFANTLGGSSGVAFDSAGDLYVANGNDNIVKFTPGGVGSIFAATCLWTARYARNCGTHFEAPPGRDGRTSQRVRQDG